MSNEDVELTTRLDLFVEYLKVQDRAIIGRVTNLVRIRDPSTGLLIATIRDPKIDILPYQPSDQIIDMQEAIVNAKAPLFNSEESTIVYGS